MNSHLKTTKKPTLGTTESSFWAKGKRNKRHSLTPTLNQNMNPSFSYFLHFMHATSVCQLKFYGYVWYLRLGRISLLLAN